MNDHQTHIRHASTAPRRGRRGFILILVLGLTVVVTTLGISFLESNSTAMPEAVNRSAAARARYLAESGIALGTHYLMYPPTTVAPGSYWTGGTGIAIDLTSDYTNVSVMQDAVDPKLFTIAAMGISKDPDGTIRGKKKATAQVIVPDDGKWHIPYALVGTSMVVPATVNIQGDIHANADVVGWGNCPGNVSSSGPAAWPGTGPPASITSGVAQYPRPQADPTLYATYNIRGAAYTAYVYNNTTMSGPDAIALNAIDMSATNPGRIIMTPPGSDLLFQANVLLTGTLVVNGNLTLDAGAVLTAVPDYPALVVTGNILFKRTGMTAQVIGSVICAGNIEDANMSGVSLSVTGACVLGGGFNFQQADGIHIFTWDQSRATFWDLRKSSERFPITVLNWKED